MRGDSGFSLIEVAASVVVLGLALGALLSLVSGGLRLAKGVSDTAGAVAAARHRLSEALAGPLERGSFAGVDGGVEWKVEVIPDEGDEDGPGGLFRVVVTAGDAATGAGHTITSLMYAPGG